MSEKEKIIKIVYKNGNDIPTLLTSNGRLLVPIFNGDFIENEDGVSFPEYKFKDETPDLSDI